MRTNRSFRLIAATLFSAILAVTSFAFAGPLNIGGSVEQLNKIVEDRGGVFITGQGSCAGAAFVMYLTADFELPFLAVEVADGSVFLIEMQDKHSHVVGVSESLTGVWTFVREFNDAQYRDGPICSAVEAAAKIAAVAMIVEQSPKRMAKHREI